MEQRPSFAQKRPAVTALNDISIRTAHIEDVKKRVQEKPWSISGSLVTDGHNSYDESFRAFGNEPIAAFLAERKRSGKTVRALDIAGGDGTAVRALKADALIADGITINRTDTRTDREKEKDLDLGVGYIGDDTFQQSALRQTRDWCTTHPRQDGDPFFDLITIRPHTAGFREGIATWIYGNIFQRVIPLLNPGGVLYSQLPPGIKAAEAQGFFATLTDRQPELGIEFKAKESVVRIIKSQKSQ